MLGFIALLQETLYNGPVVTAFNCTNSVSPIGDEEMIKPQEGRCSSICCQSNGAQRQADGKYLLIGSRSLRTPAHFLVFLIFLPFQTG